MNVVAKVEQQPGKMMLLAYMADKYALNIEEFSRTVRMTCGLPKASAEEFAAFLIVAKEYNLNPLTKEIYAFPGRGGGIVPIVSIDGWVNLVNSHRACDGFEFEMDHDSDGKLISCTCRMFRKDRSHPVAVTEYLSECVRNTDPWKMQHRMLRHKAMIQAARYAFGFSGIYDEDEGAKIAEMRDVSPREEPPAPPAMQISQQPAAIVEAEAPQTQEIISPATASGLPNPGENPDGFVRAMFAKFSAAKTPDELNDLWERHVEPNKSALFPPDEEDLMGAYRRREGELV